MMAASCVALKPRAGVEPSQAGAEPRVAESARAAEHSSLLEQNSHDASEAWGIISML